MLTSMQEMLAWFYVLVAAAGAVVSAMSLGRSRWSGLLLGGFVAETTVSLFYRVASVVMRSVSVGASSLGAAYFLASLVGLAARACVVGGLAGVLSEVPRSSASARQTQATV